MARTNEEWASLIQEKVAKASSLPAPASAVLARTLTNAELARTIDHTLLKPDATPTQIDELCRQALRYKFKSCCVNGTHVKRAAQRLQGSETIVCCVVGFPLGAASPAVKAFEAAQAVRDGAAEIDMVLNIGALEDADYELLGEDIAGVVAAVPGVPVKVILETVFWSDEKKAAAAVMVAEAGAAFIKTCTGFNGGAAEAAHVALLKRAVAYKEGAVRVKASGGIRSYEECIKMLDAGADRIGTSSGVAIMERAASQGGTY